MLVAIPAILSADQVERARDLIERAEWEDGKSTAGKQSAIAKHNRQLPHNCEARRAVAEMILAALSANGLFMSAALPKAIFPPLINRYDAAEGHGFGDHVDNAIRRDPSTGLPLRTDLSATLFLSDPDDYDGGELVVEDAFGSHIVKLPAGGLILYPASSLHHVTNVTRGVRTASFFWIQSLVRDDAKRALLLDMDVAIQRLSGAVGAVDPSVLSLTGTYHNLLRMWAEV